MASSTHVEIGRRKLVSATEIQSLQASKASFVRSATCARTRFRAADACYIRSVLYGPYQGSLGLRLEGEALSLTIKALGPAGCLGARGLGRGGRSFRLGRVEGSA